MCLARPTNPVQRHHIPDTADFTPADALAEMAQPEVLASFGKFLAWRLSRGQALAQRSLPASEEDIMALRKLGKDPESPSGGSPTIYLDEEKDNYLVQGWKVEDIERLRQMDIPGHESVVEIPRRMVQFFLEVKKDDEDSDV
jgi:hypothetical protein